MIAESYILWWETKQHYDLIIKDDLDPIILSETSSPEKRKMAIDFKHTLEKFGKHIEG